jgi:hypothetical protein
MLAGFLVPGLFCYLQEVFTQHHCVMQTLSVCIPTNSVGTHFSKIAGSSISKHIFIPFQSYAVGQGPDGASGIWVPSLFVPAYCLRGVCNLLNQPFFCIFES